MNSDLVQWYVQTTAPTSMMGVLQWKKAYLEEIPIPNKYHHINMKI